MGIIEEALREPQAPRQQTSQPAARFPVEHWDELLIHMISTKLDYNTQRDWQAEANRSRDVRKTLEEFLTFLSERCRTIEMIDLRKNKNETPKLTSSKK